MPLKRLDLKDEVSHVCRITLKKIEWELVRGIADNRFASVSPPERRVSEALRFLLRLAVSCIREHGPTGAQAPEPLTQREAIEAGLTIYDRSNVTRKTRRLRESRRGENLQERHHAKANNSRRNGAATLGKRKRGKAT